MIHSDPRTRDSIWMGVSLALSCLADPRVLDAVSPWRLNTSIPSTSSLATAPCTCSQPGPARCFLVAGRGVHRRPRRDRPPPRRSITRRPPRPATAAGPGRDRQPLAAAVPTGPHGRRRWHGVTTMPVLQSLSQARDKWGHYAAGAIWDASIVKVILGGTSATRTPRTSQHSSENETRRPIRSPSATTARGPCSDPYGVCLLCHPR